MPRLTPIPGYSHLYTLAPPGERNLAGPTGTRTNATGESGTGAAVTATPATTTNPRTPTTRRAAHEITELLGVVLHAIATDRQLTGLYTTLLSPQVHSTIRVEQRKRYASSALRRPRARHVEKITLYPAATDEGVHFVAALHPAPCYVAGYAHSVTIHRTTRWKLATLRFIAHG